MGACWEAQEARDAQHRVPRGGYRTIDGKVLKLVVLAQGRGLLFSLWLEGLVLLGLGVCGGHDGDGLFREQASGEDTVVLRTRESKALPWERRIDNGR